MHLLNKEFQKVVCINLLDRPDKKLFMEERFEKLGIEVEWYHPVKFGFIPKLVSPIVNANAGYFNLQQPFEIGAALSHYHVIKTALLEGVEKLFVFEDDLLFKQNFNDELEKSFNKLPENWDLIMLYSFMYNMEPKNVRINSRWTVASKSWSLTSYGVNKKFMEGYIQKQDQLFQIADLVSYKMQEENYKCYVTHPTLCIPNTKLESNIRKEMNYATTNTILNMGVNNNNYE